MADKTHIEWTDATWNPITGCTVLSPGCKHCYAMKLAGGRLQHHPSRAGLTTMTDAGPVWNGQVRLNTEWLDQPQRWTKPRRIFVCAHGDLFHEDVPRAWIDQVFCEMAIAAHHDFQVVTKRAELMKDYFVDPETPKRIARLLDRRAGPVSKGEFRAPDRLRAWSDGVPLPNVHALVSIEDQARANQRTVHLLCAHAAVRGLSVEPLLGPIDLTRIPDFISPPSDDPYDALAGMGRRDPDYSNDWWGCRGPRIDWVIVGGESGPGARPMHLAWVRQIRDACATASVPFLFKQCGDWMPVETRPGDLVGDARAYTYMAADGLRDAALREREERNSEIDPTAMWLAHVGKKAAGRLLDGRLHDDMPSGVAA